MKISKNIFYVLLVLAGIMLVIRAYKMYIKPGAGAAGAVEGFSQDSPFILKRDKKTYDTFYAKLYNEIFEPGKNVKFHVDAIVDATMPTTRNSVFLDVGCGTGGVVKQLNERGYRAYGIDRSRAMIKEATRTCKACRGEDDNNEKIIKEGDVLDPMNFDNGTFTHVLCLNQTIYEIEDKNAFFRNVHNWLMRSGYFVLHLESARNFTEAREKELQFRGIQYKSTFSSAATAGGGGGVVMKESFKDEQTGNVRENERVLFMEDLTDIVNRVKIAGFNVHAIIDAAAKDEKHQYLYIFEKI